LGAPDWLKLSEPAERFLNLTLSLINPDLFRSGLLMLQELRKLETTKEIATKWQSVYSGVSIISNRTTPSHRDRGGRPEWYDTLVSHSTHGARPRLLIKDLGLDLEYSSGTVANICGKVFEHEVASWGPGDRVCYAHFMRDTVRERLNVEAAGWVNRSIYLPSQ